MEKLKNILSPGHKEDDAKMYNTTATGQASSAAQNLTSDVAGQAKTTPGSSHPHPSDDPSKVSQHMPGAFASTPREELSSTAGGLGGTSTSRTTGSTTGYSSTQPPHASTAAPASATAASGTHPAHVGSTGLSSTTDKPHASTALGGNATHGSSTGYSTTQPPHSSTAAPASAAAASSTVPTHTSAASDNGSVASIKSGIAGGPHATAAAHPSAPGSTAVHTTRETVGTAEGTSTFKTTTTTALAADGTPLHSQTHRERESSAVPHAGLGASSGASPAHASSHGHDSTGVATIPASSAAGISGSGTSHHSHDPSFSNRTLGNHHYGSLDPSGNPTGTNLNTLGRDATAGLGGGAIQESQHHRVHGPHQDTHPNQPGAAVGTTNQPSISGPLPDRSRGINEPGTNAAVGQTATYSSFPVGGQHVDGPHQTATANALDPNLGSSATTSSTSATRTAPGLDGSAGHGHGHGHVGSATAVGTGAAATGAGAYGAHELSQNSQGGPGQALTTEGTARRDAPLSTGTAHQTAAESAAEKTITGNQTHHAAGRSGPSTTATNTGSNVEHAKYEPHPGETGVPGKGLDNLKHASGGGVPLAGTTEGRDQPMGAPLDKGPASSTMGPHKSNILNILDPRVKPDAAVQGSDKTSKLDSRVEGAGATGGAATAAGTAGHHGTTSSTTHQQQSTVPASATDQRNVEHGTTHPTSSTTSTSHGTAQHGTAQHGTTQHGTTSDSRNTSSTYASPTSSTTAATASDPQQQLAHDATKRSDVADPSIGSDAAHGQDSGRHGLSSLLHRDNPNKLHKDPPSK